MCVAIVVDCCAVPRCVFFVCAFGGAPCASEPREDIQADFVGMFVDFSAVRTGRCGRVELAAFLRHSHVGLGTPARHLAQVCQS